MQLSTILLSVEPKFLYFIELVPILKPVAFALDFEPLKIYANMATLTSKPPQSQHN